MGLALTAAAALWDTRWRVVPTETGAWRGLSDPPTAVRLALAVAFGVAGAVCLSRAPRALRLPLLALAVVLLPAVPVLAGGLPLLLAFQGPVLVLVVAMVAAVVLVRALSAARPDSAPAALPAGLLFLAAFAFFALLSTRLPGPAGPQGDEPQYLLLAHSLLTDGDVDLADEFAQRDHGAFFAGPLEAHTSPFSRPGQAYSIHTPGLGALVLPAYALAGYAGVRLLLCGLAALAALLVHRVARVVGGSEIAAAGAWAVLVFTPPLPFYAMRVYPETAAVLASAAFLWASVAAPAGRAVLVAALVAAALPWFHPKLLLLALLGLALTLLRPTRWAMRLAAAGAVAVSLGLLLAQFHAHFGRVSLQGGFPATNLSPGLLPRGTAAVLFDRQFGLLAVSPVFALALPGAWALARRRQRPALPAALVALLFLGLAGGFTFWWGGACPPARYVLPAVPALAVLLAPALARRPTLGAALAGLGAGVVGLAADAPRIVHNRADGESLLLRFLSPAVDLNGLFPSFFDTGAAPLVLAALWAAAGAMAWRWRRAGLAAAVVLLVLGSVARGDRPWVDRRAATLDLLWDWQPDRLAGPDGPPVLAALALPFELPRAPWLLEALEQRNSRRLDVPAGRYLFRAAIRPQAAPARVRVELGAGPLVFADGVLDADRTDIAVPVLLPAGARRIGVSAAGEEGRAELVEAHLVPEALVPRADRGRFTWPEQAEPARYRVAAGPVRVTVLDRTAPDGDGFRLDGPQGEMLADGPADALAALHIHRARPLPADSLRWESREIPLGPRTDVVLHLPLADGVHLGPDAVVPFRIRAEGAWVRVGEPK